MVNSTKEGSKETNFLISVLKLKSLKEMEIKKSYISNQRIEIFPDQLKNYLEYFQKYNVNNFSIKKIVLVPILWTKKRQFGDFL